MVFLTASKSFCNSPFDVQISITPFFLDWGVGRGAWGMSLCTDNIILHYSITLLCIISISHKYESIKMEGLSSACFNVCKHCGVTRPMSLTLRREISSAVVWIAVHMIELTIPVDSSGTPTTSGG